MTTIIVADDHPIVLEGLVSLLQQASYAVLARCENGRQVLAALERHRPDVVILDVKGASKQGNL